MHSYRSIVRRPKVAYVVAAVAAIATAPLVEVAFALPNPIGTWQLAEDQNHPGLTDDFMDLSKDGVAILRDSKGVYAKCTYTTQDSGVLLKCLIKGTEKALFMRTHSDGQSLVNSRGDIYRKLP